ncbi:uncharacterized protein LOC141646800 isoform X3 [Silene latifolia]|uniref:uncharacterized protein LOC141646800 isoform X3 n=1 Tax=Silene latifolia TaxID=37657 RepID=UPI003D780A8F
MRSNVSGVGFYNSEPRNFNRGYGRGNPRPYQSSQPPPSPQPQRKGDLFVEAGQLAVEYLVSRGLLSSDVIPGKTQDHSNSQDQGISKTPSGVSSDQRSLNGNDVTMSRNYSGEKGKHETSRSYSSDYSQENGRVVSLPEKTSSPNTMDVDNDKYKEENSEVCVNKEGSHDDAKHETEICHPLIDSDSRIAFSLEDKDNKKPPNSLDEAKEEMKDGPCNLDHGQKVQLSENYNDASPKENTNMSKVHCFLSDISLKQEPVLIGQEMNVSDTGRDFLNSVKHDNMNDSSGITSSSEISGANCPNNALSDHPFRSVGPINALSDHPFTGEKRAHEEDCKTEGAKKARPWLSVAQSNEYPFSDMSENNPISPEKRDATICNESTDHKSFHIVSLPLHGGVESAMDRREEKQLFSSSYKICDLNLMEGSEMHEGHVVGSLLYPSLSAPKKEAQIDIDLSMSNNFSTFMGDYNDSGSVRKNVEIIDLESSSMEEGKDSNFPTKNSEGGITNMVNFADNQQHANDNADGQDKYGLMISELLGNDVPNCSTAQPDINSLQNDMGMHHGEGMFTEDDPIYMSLGEIPLSLLQGWEQQPQERNPFQL